MFTSLRDQMPSLSTKPDVLVSDFATYGGFDAADYFDIPLGQAATASAR